MASNRYFSGQENHSVVVFDAISEGEIVGLVNGDASIYFDDVPLRDGTTQMERGSFSTLSTTVAASAVVTLSVVIFGGLMEGKQWAKPGEVFRLAAVTGLCFIVIWCRV